MRAITLALSLAALLQAGCATVPVDRGKDVSTAGIAYSRATASVIDVAIDAAIDASSERQIRRRLGPATTPEDKTKREASLTELDNTLVVTVQLYTRLKRSVSAVEGYFTGLQALAGATPGAAAENEVKTLVDRVNGLNKALESGTPINDEKKGAIAGIAGLLVRQAHGAALARALERDAEPIARALVLQELTLRAARSDIVGSMNDANARFYRDRVLTPFLAGNVSGSWADDRRTALKARAVGSTPEAVASAEEAARQMQAVWGRILSGETSGQELIAIMKDTQELLDAAIALKKANKGE
jgi:predicted small secreted protein